MFRFIWLIAIALLVPHVALAAEDGFFEKRIRPVLHEHCMECHGAENQKGGLRLDSREALLNGGDSGPALIPGQSDESLLLKAVRQEGVDLKMPPLKAGPKLPDAVITDLATWIQAGAAWPPHDSPAASKEVFDLEAQETPAVDLADTAAAESAGRVGAPAAG